MHRKPLKAMEFAVVENLFTGRSQPTTIQGRPDTSAFVRAPGCTHLRLHAGGIDGNELAPRRLGNKNHAAYLFPHGHYRHFEDLLGRALTSGAFAENVTYQGPDENELRMGDKLRIGTAVIELTTPRVPCYKLAHFLDADPGFPSAFSASGRTGTYARIVEAGEISLGDSFSLVHTDPANATIAELNQVLTGARPTQHVIDKVLGSPAMFAGLRELIDDRLQRLGLTSEAASQRTRITARVDEAPNVVSLSFDMPIAAEALPRPGQFITFGITDDDGEQHFRCYSLTDAPFDGDPARPWRIAVKRDDQSTNRPAVSSWIHDRLAVGTWCTVYPPAGDFVLPEGMSGPLAFIAGGIGITPILAQVRALASRGYADPIDLIYIVRRLDDAAFLSSLDTCCTRLGNLSLRIFLTREAEASALDDPRLRCGRPDLLNEISRLHETTELYVCGPVAMIDQVREIHATLGRPNAKLHFELFGDATELGEVTTVEQAEIGIPSAAVSGTWTATDGPILNWIERNTLYRPPAACRSGICRTCMAGLTRGQVVYPASVVPPGPTEVLLCCARPASDIDIELNAISLGVVAE